jgi:hypothetical protein
VYLAASEVIGRWERGVGRSGQERATVLLGAAFPGAREDDLGGLPIGQRDAALVDLRASLFGSRVDGTIVCGNCGEMLELAFDVDDVRVAPPDEGSSELRVERTDYGVSFRLPAGDDLAAVAGATDVAEARTRLLQRCVLGADRDGVPLDTGDLPEDIVVAVEEAMAAADPGGDVEVETECPACATAQRVAFDPVSFLWTELDAYAGRLLWEVHELASAYGWSESQILGLSAARRAAYLELASP